MDFKTVRKLISTGLMCVFAALGLFGALKPADTSTIEHRDVETDGVITSKDAFEFKNRRMRVIDVRYSFKYRYADESGETRFGDETVTKERYDRIEEGKPIRVIYSATNPGRSMPIGFGGYYMSAAEMEASKNAAKPQLILIISALLIIGVIRILSLTGFLSGGGGSASIGKSRGGRDLSRVLKTSGR